MTFDYAHLLPLVPEIAVLVLASGISPAWSAAGRGRSSLAEIMSGIPVIP